MAMRPRLQSARHRRRRAGIILFSVTLHGLILTPLALHLDGSTPKRPAAPHQTPLYVDIEPRPRLALQPGRAPTAPAHRPRRANPSPVRQDQVSPAQPDSSAPAPEVRVLASSPPDRGRWQVRPEFIGAPPSPVTGRGASGYRSMAERLDPGEQARCDQLFAEAAAGRAPITGTNNPVRDARFAALGDQALANYDRRRAPLTPNSRARPCPHPTDLMGRCPVQVIVPIFSSRDGWLPGLKKDD